MISALLKIWSIEARARTHLLRATASTFLFRISDIVPDIIIGLTINLAFLKKQSFLCLHGFACDLSTVYFLGGVILLALLINSATQFLSSLEFKFAATKIHHRLKMDLCRHILTQPDDQAFEEHETILAKERQKNLEIDAIELFISRTLEDFFKIMFSSLIIGSILFFIDFNFLFFVLLPLPITFLFAFFLEKKMGPHYDKIKQATKEMHYEVDNLVNGLTTIKDFGIEDRVFLRVESKAESLKKLHEIKSYLSLALLPMTQVFIQVAFLAILIHGVTLVFHNQITIGAFAATIFLSRKFLFPFSFLGALVDNCAAGIKALKQISLYVNKKAFLPTKILPSKLEAMKPIVFNKIGYSYRNKQILSDISFEFKSERINVIKGCTGTGKTTLFKLLMRKYSSDSGSIFYGDAKIDNYSAASWRQNIALVPQFPKLFQASVVNNITLFAPEVDEERLGKALENSLTQEFIKLLPGGINALVGACGINLSGGQIQSIALARAFYKNPKILLLDEPTAGFDPEREWQFINALKHIIKGKIVIITSHREQMIEAADNLLEI